MACGYFRFPSVFLMMGISGLLPANALPIVPGSAQDRESEWVPLERPVAPEAFGEKAEEPQKEAKEILGDLSMATHERIHRAEVGRAKLLRQELRNDSVLLTFIASQPSEEEIAEFFAPMRQFLRSPESMPVRRLLLNLLQSIPRTYGLREGKMRAIYVIVPFRYEPDGITGATFPATSEKDGEDAVCEELHPKKMEVGVPVVRRTGTRYMTREAHPGWMFEYLVNHPDIKADLRKHIQIALRKEWANAPR